MALCRSGVRNGTVARPPVRPGRCHCLVVLRPRSGARSGPGLRSPLRSGPWAPVRGPLRSGPWRPRCSRWHRLRPGFGGRVPALRPVEGRPGRATRPGWSASPPARWFLPGVAPFPERPSLAGLWNGFPFQLTPHEGVGVPTSAWAAPIITATTFGNTTNAAGHARPCEERPTRTARPCPALRAGGGPPPMKRASQTRFRLRRYHQRGSRGQVGWERASPLGPGRRLLNAPLPAWAASCRQGDLPGVLLRARDAVAVAGQGRGTCIPRR